MSKRTISLIIAISSLALAAGLSAAPVRTDGFGPTVASDATLNKSLGVLRRQIAWLNSAYGDVFQVAQATVEDQNFDSVAILSSPTASIGRWPNVRDDASLDSSNGLLSQMIAWHNSPAGDAFLVAQGEPIVKGDDFQRVALASIPYGSSGFAAQ